MMYEAFKSGAFAYLVKPCYPLNIIINIRNALLLKRVQAEYERLKKCELLGCVKEEMDGKREIIRHLPH